MDGQDPVEKRAQERRNAVREVLSKPVVLETTDYVAKIRQNLMIASTVTIAILFFGVHAAESQSFIGLTLEKLSTQKLKIGLLAINGYILVHFLWLMFDAFQSWRIRLTGSGALYGHRSSFRSDESTLSTIRGNPHCTTGGQRLPAGAPTKPRERGWIKLLPILKTTIRWSRFRTPTVSPPTSS
ncbi:hypothetical protein [Variovorax sp. YR266]|uniref:hypothetical protein n=1 Tax=Variovorax sp. YR266 TaxID=1884386 RepID=UPI00115F97F0|nr:hypothetical protein [Variovorax sp. YR266]